jgi:hypothetical protein
MPALRQCAEKHIAWRLVRNPPECHRFPVHNPVRLDKLLITSGF